MTNRTDDLLNFDPLQAAEDITGSSYKASEGTSMLGLAIAMSHNQAKREHLESIGDTTFGSKLGAYLAIVRDIGFEQVYEAPIDVESCGRMVHETHYIFAHRDGILLNFDTYWDRTSVNGGNFYYCWEQDPSNTAYGYTSSGKFIVYDKENNVRIWAGSHDCREALRHHINKLREGGRFLAKWPDNNNIWLWLLNFGDTKDDKYDYKAINAARIAQLPTWVQEMINR